MRSYYADGTVAAEWDLESGTYTQWSPAGDVTSTRPLTEDERVELESAWSPTVQDLIRPVGPDAAAHDGAVKTLVAALDPSVRAPSDGERIRALEVIVSRILCPPE